MPSSFTWDFFIFFSSAAPMGVQPGSHVEFSSASPLDSTQGFSSLWPNEGEAHLLIWVLMDAKVLPATMVISSYEEHVGAPEMQCDIFIDYEGAIPIIERKPFRSSDIGRDIKQWKSATSIQTSIQHQPSSHSSSLEFIYCLSTIYLKTISPSLLHFPLPLNISIPVIMS